MKERLEPRLRILLGPAIAVGPGKAALLEAIDQTGSIAAAGRRMGMSYRRAWFLVKTMNACFRKPLVDAAKGGLRGGGAALTPTGREVLKRYRAMESRATKVIAADMKAFSRLLAQRPPEE
ncbi:MAG: LysR family transcriptional regulator [Alphaproteobacteria bacterium]|nr:LysR family transcriptional regulator [Alphaproteobacteria bacterium]